MSRVIRSDRDRKGYHDKRIWIGHNLAHAHANRLRDESGKLLSASRLALRYDFLRPELREKDKITANVSHYWKKKALDPALHAGSHGGHRWEKLERDGFEGCKDFVYASLWRQINDFPESQMATLTDVANEAIRVFAEDRGVEPVEVSRRWVARVFKSWRWSWKVPTVVQLHKFTPENIQRYLNYIVFVAGIPLRRLKFADEIHFVSRGTLSPFALPPFLSSPSILILHNMLDLSAAKVLGPVGQRVHVLSRHWLNVRVHVTFFTNLGGETFPFAATAIYENNTGETFRDAVFDALDNGVLVDGDYFIIDGAAVHFAADTFDEITERLRAAGVHRLF